MMVATLPPQKGERTTSSFFRETRDLPRFEEHGYVSRHVSEKSLEAAWQARVRYHNMNGRPRHSKRVLEWNGHYVLYDLHLPPGTSLPVSAMHGGSIAGGSSSASGTISMNSSRSNSSESSESSGTEGSSTGHEGPPLPEHEQKSDKGSPATSACKRRTVFRSNGGLVSPNGRYTFVQHNDNELVIYDREGGKIWSCPGSKAVDVRNPEAEKEMNTVFTEFQHDGALVQYAERKSKGWGGQGKEVLWRSHSGPPNGDRLVMQDDGNLVIYNSKTLEVAWESGTAEEGGPNRIILR